MTNNDDLLINVLKLCSIPLPKQRRSFDTYHRILRSAQQCTAELGYGRTSTQEIANRAEISHGGLFKRFPTKVSIMAAMVGYVEAQARRNAMERLATSDLPTSTRDRVESFIQEYWSFVQTQDFTAIDEVWDQSRTDQQLLQALRPVIASDVVAGDLRYYFPQLQNGVEIQFLSQIVYSALEYLAFNHGLGVDEDARLKLEFITDMVCREIDLLAAKA